VVLAVFAHPDDESLACGGTLAMLSRAGARVVVVCATHGERGSHNGPVRDDSLARARAIEMHEAAEALGIAEIRLLSHPDGDLRWADVAYFNAELMLSLRRSRATAVITFGEDGLYWHPDHIGVHERVVAAVVSLGREAPPLYFVTMQCGSMTTIVSVARSRGWMPPPKGFWSIAPEAFGLLTQPYPLLIDVRADVPRKLKALSAHRSQMGTDHPFVQLSADEAGRLLGVECFRRADVPGRPGRLLEQLCTSNS
jgi:LmbE family N-acetylglucosaminyl deacetylase